jgi:Spy/CpxP family protein refolding chaperone
MLKYLLFIGFMTLSAGAAQGQKADEPPMPHERLELIRMWRLVDELQIDGEQAARLFPFWSSHRRERRELHQRRKKAADELVDLLKREEIGEEILKEKLEKVRGIDQEKEELARVFHEKMAELLTVRQQARLLLFEDRFRKDLQEFLREVRPFRRQREGARERGFWDRDETWR